MSRNVLDKYRVIAQLGRGGMADVYLAASHGPGGFSKLLVIKVLQASLARTGEFLKMFRDEARLAARLNHPNVVQTYEVGESEGRHFIAMEYLEGQPLNRVIDSWRSEGPLDLATALRIAIDALAGLHYAHELRDFDGTPLGVVHRDITPQNVFVTYEGQIKLVDFGIAKALDSSTETKVGTVKGKVSYMAPEQARGELVTRTADIFSLGVVLWELLTGRRLWEGLTDVAVIGRLVHGDVPDVRSLRPELPESLADLVMRALDPNPSQRPQSAAEFHQGLDVELEKLSSHCSNRQLGERMRHTFQDQRSRVRQVISKQLERLVRNTPSGETPPGGWKLQGNAGDMPVLGEGSSVHDAPTTIHTGVTQEVSGFSSPDLTTGATPAALETASLRTQNRNITVVALLAVGAAGIAIGTAQPWRDRNAATLDAARENAISNESISKLALPAADSIDRAPVRCSARNKPIVELTGEIGEDARLTCDKDYLLRFTTFVAPGATLTIEPGTVIRGDLDTKGTLVVQPGGRIEARGTSELPIVFTSDADKKQPGDWGGLILLGNAPINLRDNTGVSMNGHVEGISSGGRYGGSNPDDSSGTLRYVRIEYPGTEIAPNNEINGLTLAGVGRGTVIDHVQVRHPADDCFEFFGGTADAKYLACQHPGDDAFDWDYGYAGRLQFLVAQAHPRISKGSHALEGDNDPNGSSNTPISAPTIYNVTLCGKNRPIPEGDHLGLLLRRGSHLRMRNALIVGYDAGVDVRDVGTKLNLAASLFNHNVTHNLAYPETETSQGELPFRDDDGGFDELAYLKNPGLRISTHDPQLGNCFAQHSPDFAPREILEKEAAIPPRDGFFEPQARFVGALRDADDDWNGGNWLVWGD